MRKFLSLCSLSLACGAPASPDAPAPAELGQAAQALITGLPDGYGWTPSANNGGRCFTGNGAYDWAGDCYVPGRRRVNILVKKSSCTGPFAALYGQALDLVYSNVHSILTARGWAVIRDGSNPEALHNYNGLRLECGSPFSESSGNAGGGTRIDADLDCIDTQYGDLCEYVTSVSRIYPSRIQGGTFMSSTTTDLRRKNYIYNLALHEVGHSVGLGHDACGPTPLAQVMNHAGCMSDDSSTWGQKAFTQVELDWLRDYRVP